MRHNRGGFTILEVMIVLVISGAMLAAALVAINGQQNRTEFTLGMRDIDSKLQDVLNDVSNGNFSYNNDKCNVVGGPVNGRPHLSPGGPGDEIGSRSECLFLGEALQFSTSNSSSTGGVNDNARFAIYTVLGRRLMTGALGSPVSVNSFDEANPTVMAGSGPHDLTTYYDFEQGITTKSIFYTPAIPPGASQTINQYTLLGLFTSFTSAGGNIGNSNADASQSLQAYTYKLADGSAFDPPGNSGARKCIDDNDQSSLTCPFDKSLSSATSKGLGICFDSNNGTNQTALITIYNSSEGVNTRLEYNPGGGLC